MATPERRTEQQVGRDVRRELGGDAGVDSAGVEISADGGAVTLTGRVKSHSEKQSAVAAALRVRGVTAVTDDIVVRSRRVDADLAYEAAAALSSPVLIPADSVATTVHEDRGTLIGTVVRQFQDRAADRAVGAVRGHHRD